MQEERGRLWICWAGQAGRGCRLEITPPPNAVPHITALTLGPPSVPSSSWGHRDHFTLERVLSDTHRARDLSSVCLSVSPLTETVLCDTVMFYNAAGDNLQTASAAMGCSENALWRRMT